MLVIAFVIALYGLWGLWKQRFVTYGPGVVVKNAPFQKDLADAKAFSYKQYTIQPMAEFQIEARILGVEYYRFDAGSELSPVDLALGWQPMSDESVLKAIEISQMNRFYFWKVAKFPIPRRDIETHSANMHLIPANDRIQQQMENFRLGQVIHISGYLVYITKADGWRWKSSLSRNDTGGGSCEVIWVNQLRLNP
ncbi:hypothetical protein WDW89_15120 [Deltaproteobacteria bacterium TL4]